MPARTPIVIALAALLASAGCNTLEPPSELSPGSWGGEHLLLVVEADSAQLEYDCATGVMYLPVSVNGDGTFTASGIHYLGHGGPVGQDGLEPHPARYEGRIRGSRMTLTVTMTDRATAVGTFELERGRTAHVFKCL